jgi:thiamine biosynthesis lipoprotein
MYLSLNLRLSMYKRTALPVYFLYIVCSVLYAIDGSTQERKFSFTMPKMGSPFGIVISASDSAQAAAAATKAFLLVDSLNSIFSDYDSTSELSRLSKTAGNGRYCKVSGKLWELMLIAQKAWKKSSGAFDITVGPLSLLWRKARKEHRFPNETEIKAARDLVGSDKIILRPSDSSVLLTRKGMRLDMGGIAKGYIARQTAAFLASQGMQHSLVDAGGDMAMNKAPGKTGGWKIGINVPETTDELLPRRLLLENMAVATSGDIYQYMEHGGKKYSHIIDPRTGYGITLQRNVTVLARDGADADWLATACSVLPVREAILLAQRMGAEVLINEVAHGKTRSYFSSSFRSFMEKTY